MGHTREFYVILKEKLPRQEFNKQLVKLSEFQDTFAIELLEGEVYDEYKSGDEVIYQMINFFNLIIIPENIKIPCSIVCHAEITDHFALSQLNSVYYMELQAYQDRFLETLMTYLPNWQLLAHDNFAPHSISRIYEVYQTGENLDELWIHYIQA